MAEIKIENGKKYVKTNIYGEEWVDENRLNKLIDSAKGSINKINNSMNGLTDTQKNNWINRKNKIQSDLNYYQKVKKEMNGSSSRGTGKTSTSNT